MQPAWVCAAVPTRREMSLRPLHVCTRFAPGCPTLTRPEDDPCTTARHPTNTKEPSGGTHTYHGGHRRGSSATSTRAVTSGWRRARLRRLHLLRAACASACCASTERRTRLRSSSAAALGDDSGGAACSAPTAASACRTARPRAAHPPGAGEELVGGTARAGCKWWAACSAPTAASCVPNASRVLRIHRHHGRRGAHRRRTGHGR